MRLLNFVPLIAVTEALVLPTAEQLQDLDIRESRHRHCLDNIISEKDYLVHKSKDFFNRWSGSAEEAFHQAYQTTSDEIESLSDKFTETTSDAKSWLSAYTSDLYEDIDARPPHHGDDPHHEPNMTVYQLIAGSKYTTKLAKLINEFDDLVEALNSTKGNFTVFAPTDSALDKIPEDAPKPSKEQLKKFLSYHVVPENYPAGRVLFADTAPTLLKSDHLGSEPLHGNKYKSF